MQVILLERIGRLGQMGDVVAVKPGFFTEDNIRAALGQAKGDIFVAACLIETTAPMLDRYIRSSESLQAFAAAVERVKADPDYDRMSKQQFIAELQHLTSQFAVDGLLAIHQLAIEPACTAADRDVKLRAAIALRDGAGRHHIASDVDLLMAELNQSYQQHAPRIKEIRTTVVTLEGSGQSESSHLTVEPARG